MSRHFQSPYAIEKWRLLKFAFSKAVLKKADDGNFPRFLSRKFLALSWASCNGKPEAVSTKYTWSSHAKYWNYQYKPLEPNLGASPHGSPLVQFPPRYTEPPINMSKPNPNSEALRSSPTLVLGSTSPFRRELLARLGLPFETCAPEVDERHLPDESPEQLVLRLAQAKAEAAAAGFARALVIGSDQVACIGGRILGKPGNRDNARAQLREASGKRVSFYTGLCLLNTDSGRKQLACEPFHVQFRHLSAGQIEHYLDREQPYNCAGSFKSEGLGIVLFERLEGDDPNSLIGLPLIRLVTMLGAEGVELP